MSFDRLAPHYRWMEFVLAGGRLQRCRTAFLNEVGRRRDVLLLGEGNGRFLVECRRALPQAHITCVDSSARMLDEARRRLVNSGLGAGNTEFLKANALDWKPPKPGFDLVVTHFFLDCFRPDQLEALMAALARVATPRATWLLADFRVPPAGGRRLRALLIHRLMYLFFRFATDLPAQCLTAPDRLLEANGFELRERRLSEWGLLHSDWWERRLERSDEV